MNGVKAGQVDTAEARLNEALSVVPPQRAEVRLAQAEIAMARGQARKAMTLRRLVAFEFPMFGRSWELLAEAADSAHDCIELARATSRMHAIDSTVPSVAKFEAKVREQLPARGREGGLRAGTLSAASSGRGAPSPLRRVGPCPRAP